jgi:NhaP-type Na+/H+ or K+/H+ antiporter
MTLLLVFAVTLLAAVLVSELAERSILSASVLFLIAGFLTGRGFFGAAPELNRNLLERLSEIALFSILFTDGLRTRGIRSILDSWHLPGRALLIGMPVTILAIALLARYSLHTSWVPAFLIAAVLSPTDPVFVSGIFRFQGITDHVKRLLNVESGLNDGLALPIVVLLLAQLRGQHENVWPVVLELLIGIVIGVGVPWLGIRLEESRLFKAVGIFQPLNAFSLGLLVLAICYGTGANLFLAAFAAGISVATFSTSVAESFQRFGELLAELFKLAALLIFGAMMAPRLFVALSGWDYLFIALATFLIRPPAVLLSLLGTELGWHERLLAGWFGPKGFASVVYGLLILHAGLTHLAHLVGLAVTASIVVFSSTDILLGRWFEAHHVPKSPPSQTADPGVSQPQH